ncbi:cell wall protein DAN4 [Biomphalaria pfeifferi]|uniref:Cell wall protein DAN4 n=1 Tax=Biomphalaria pfeifferi TaxID=112525 RepID=A0AAD8AXP0_BIOPF|nr:cell wall protein DAN4 [Biomphalaria pfeifferi]
MSSETTLTLDETTPEVTETTPEVTETTAEVTETTPEVSETTPEVSETTPVVTETTSAVTETTPKVAESTEEFHDSNIAVDLNPIPLATSKPEPQATRRTIYTGGVADIKAPTFFISLPAIVIIILFRLKEILS